MDLKINSRRRYTIAVADQHGLSTERLSLNTLFRNKEGYEYKYAIADMIDAILDLKEGESLYFQSNRDDTNSKGIILRTQ